MSSIRIRRPNSRCLVETSCVNRSIRETYSLLWGMRVGVGSEIDEGFSLFAQWTGNRPESQSCRRTADRELILSRGESPRRGEYNTGWLPFGSCFCWDASMCILSEPDWWKVNFDGLFHF